jgi:hypothetical protein
LKDLKQRQNDKKKEKDVDQEDSHQQEGFLKESPDI